MAFGVTQQGFVTKQQADIQADLEAAFKAAFGAGINLTPSSRFSQFIGIMAERLADLWAQLQLAYNSQYPDTAKDTSLDNVLALTGVLRLQPTRSTVTLTNTGTPGTLLPALRTVQVAGTLVQFRTTLDATIGAVAAWAGLTLYVVGGRVTNGGNVYQALAVVGNSAAAGGPTGTGTAIVDGGVTWKWIGAGTGAVDVAGESVLYGPQPGPAGQISGIVTPVAGWNNVINLLDAAVGRNLEDDGSARVRRDGLLRAQGNAAADAVRSKVLLVAGVTDCVIFDNPLPTVDANGVPGNSFETLVTGGTDLDVANAIWASKPDGIQAFGSTTQAVVDSKGNPQSVKFTRPTLKPIYVAVVLTTTSAWDAVNGPAAVKQALVNFSIGKLQDTGGTVIGSAFKAGDDVFDTPLYRAVFSVPGIQDITSLFIGLAAAPGSNADIVIAARELAVFDTSRVTVNGA